MQTSNEIYDTLEIFDEYEVYAEAVEVPISVIISSNNLIGGTE